jgi:hypothetical protein
MNPAIFIMLRLTAGTLSLECEKNQKRLVVGDPEVGVIWLTLGPGPRLSDRNHRLRGGQFWE